MSSEYARQQRRFARRRQDEGREAARDDLRNDELDQDVACCLADIDEALDREKDEREQAVREFDRLGESASDRELNLWQARYAHLGLRYGRCCGTPFMISTTGTGEHRGAGDPGS